MRESGERTEAHHHVGAVRAAAVFSTWEGLMSPRWFCRALVGGLLLLAPLAAQSEAAPVTAWEFDAGLFASAEHPNITASSIFVNVGGGTLFGGTGNPVPSLLTEGWDTGGNVADPAKYFAFSITVDVGYVLTLTNLSFDEQALANGPPAWQVSTVADNFTTSVLGGATTIGAFGNHSVDLTGEPGLSGITSPFEIRIYGFGDLGGDNSGDWYIDNIILEGDIIPLVPEPSSLALAAVGFIALAAGRWRRRKG